MVLTRPIRACVAMIATSMLVAVPESVLGSGLSTPVVGSGWSTPTQRDPAAVFHNPAALAGVLRPTLQVTASVSFLNLSYTRERRADYAHADSFDFALPLDPSDVDATKRGRDDTMDAVGLLPAGGAFFALPITDRVTLGLGAYAPFGALLDLDDNGPQQWALQSATIVGLFVTPAVGVQVTDWLQVGVGVSAVFGTLEIAKTVDLAGTELIGGALREPPIGQDNDFGASAPTGVRELDITSRPFSIRGGSALGWSFNAGVLITPVDGLDIGLSYTHEAAMTFRGDFYLNMNDPFFTTDLASQGLAYPGLVEGDAWVEFPFPRSARLGVEAELGAGLSVAAQLAWVGYSSVEAFDVTIESEGLAQPALGLGPVAKIALPRRWRDSWEAEARVAWHGEGVAYGVRAGFHTGFSPDATVDVGSPDGDRLRLTPLGRWALDESWSLSAELDVQWVLPRDVRSSDFDLANGRYELLLITAAFAVELAL